MKRLEEYSRKFGIKKVVNSMGEIRYTKTRSIIFPNGWVASIAESRHGLNCDTSSKWSVAMCNYDGYFDWSILNGYGATNGKFYCNTISEIIEACEIIRKLE